MRHRASVVDKMFGENSSDTKVFLQSVLDSNLQKNQNMQQILKYLRFFPGRTSFRAEWQSWIDDFLLNDYAKIIFSNV